MDESNRGELDDDIGLLSGGKGDGGERLTSLGSDLDGFGVSLGVINASRFAG